MSSQYLPKEKSINPNATISGKIKKIIYESKDTAYVIAIVTTAQGSQTICGTMPNPREGEQVELSGVWKTHPKYGKQFAFKAYSSHVPQTLSEIQGFLESLDGIGVATAKKIVDVFGETALQIIEQNPDRLLKIGGITENKLKKLVASFHEKIGMQRLISFLHSIEISATHAAKIHKKYGSGSVAIIKNNPYILAKEIRGVGFQSADKIALALGIPRDSPLRIQAALIHSLREASQMQGHCFLEKEVLCSNVEKLLYLPSCDIEIQAIAAQIDCLSEDSRGQLLVQECQSIYPLTLYAAELGLANKLSELSGNYDVVDAGFIEEWIANYEKSNQITFSLGQQKAIESVASNGLTVITGGAGVGKSTLAKAIALLWDSFNLRIVATAPTGKAAQRIKEVAGIKAASTIHRLLEWTDGVFARNEENPIEADAFIIDEFSMVDVSLAWALFRAIPPHAVVVIIGDPNQLPSIGPGSVLKDIIASKTVPVVPLTEIFRQAENSKIIQASRSIIQGDFPNFDVFDFSNLDAPDTIDSILQSVWIPCGGGEIKSTIKWLLERGLPCGKEEIQLLSPIHKGEVGNIALNELAQEIWNFDCGQPTMGCIRVDDRVIQTANDYSRQVFNGDIGVVEYINLENNRFFVRFECDSTPRIVKYERSDLENLALAYSISIHKAQGSEFPVVIIPVTMQHYMMLQRNILYTGFTRGKRLVIIVGEKEAIELAVRNQKSDCRNTSLADRLTSFFQ